MRLIRFLSMTTALMVFAATADTEIRESSGIAVDSSGALWTINDGPNIGERVADHSLYALAEDGSVVRRVEVEARNSDWEDLAAFHYGKKNYLLIADTGDNLERREESRLYAVEEPDQDPAKVAWRIRFRYADRPHDCEAVAVDPVKNRVLLVTKREAVAQIHALPLNAGKSVQTAAQIGALWPLPQSSVWVRITHPMLGRFTHQPTGLDISRDGRLAVIVTYDDAYLWRRKPGESWEQALAREPNRVIVLPGVRQYEGAAFSRDGATLYVSEEGNGAVTVVKLSD